MLVAADVADLVEHVVEPVPRRAQRRVPPRRCAAGLRHHHPAAGEPVGAVVEEVPLVEPVELVAGVVGALVGQVDDDHVVARAVAADPLQAVGVVHPDRPVPALGRRQGLRGVAVGQVCRTRPDRGVVDVDVVHERCAAGDRQLADHPLARPDDQHPLAAARRQRGRHEQRLVVDQLRRLRALPLVVTEQGDAVRGVGDQDVLEVRGLAVVDTPDLPGPGEAGRDGLDDAVRLPAARFGPDLAQRRAQGADEQGHRAVRVGRVAAREHVDERPAVLGPRVHRCVGLGQQRDDRDPLRRERLGDQLPHGGSGPGQRVGEGDPQPVDVVEKLGVDVLEVGEDVAADGRGRLGHDVAM